MPFRMVVRDVRDDGTELTVTGSLIEGAYMGPEAVLLCGRRGAWVPAAISQHAIDSPRGWPVVPNDGSTLILTIGKPSAAFVLDRSQPVVGQGAITHNESRLDISETLAEPAFWATWMPPYLDSEELPEPSLAWGLTGDEADRAYEAQFQARWDSGVWPYVRVGLTGSRYVELEFAAGIEFQERLWIGRTDGPRVLLGYDSGHSSFPSLRLPEVLDLAKSMQGHPAAPLLLLPGAHLTDDEEFPQESIREWLQASPGLRPEYLDLVVSELSKNVVSGLAWEFTADRGWTNNWHHSQRNPGSPLSILGPEDFRFIRECFRDWLPRRRCSDASR